MSKEQEVAGGPELKQFSAAHLRLEDLLSELQERPITISAAADGVGARTSAAKSARVTSTS